ncbi:MAG: hypothetical protein N2484_06700 [Clostridia bacterium]|nr:hypothetical protein [Clostridia bacterium]
MKVYKKFNRCGLILLAVLFTFVSTASLHSISGKFKTNDSQTAIQASKAEAEQKKIGPPQDSSSQTQQSSDSPAQVQKQAESSTAEEESKSQPTEPNSLKQSGGENQAELDRTLKLNDESQLIQEKSTIQRSPSKQNTASVSRGIDIQRKADFLLPWFGTAEKLFAIGTRATVTDLDTGISFKVKRTYGYNHADVETLTSQDTEILKKLAGDGWSWERRAIAVDIKGVKIAASMNLMPHAGTDDQPANQKITLRSGGYGPGENLDSIKGNDMDGHFCIHFYQSKTHGSDKVDDQHQEMVKKAYQRLLKNLLKSNQQ